jgi:aryl-alcohol dehydrogenase-like predicted oxidoreductase
MNTLQLGRAGPTVSRIGFGCMGLSDTYGPSDDTESLRTLHAAVDAGITLFDTGDFYGMGHNEMLLARLLREVPRDKVLLSVKFGAMRSPEGAFVGFDGRPVAVKNFIAYSLKRLRTDYIDIYRPARLDPSVPIEDTVGAIAELIRAGYVRYLGLSEVGVATIRRAQAVHPVVDLQIEYSLMSRSIEPAILPAVRELGIAVTAYGVLSRGLLSGKLDKSELGIRAHMPRFNGENLDRNLSLVDRLAQIAAEKGITAAQLAIAWVLARGDDIVPLIGTRSTRRLKEALDALAISLTPSEISRIEAALPPSAVAGTRYAGAQMAMLDSEKS